MTFDTLAFCKRLQEGGVPPDQAEAHARAQADFLADYPLSEMTVKKDLERFATKKDLERFATKEDLKRFATKEDLKRFATKEDLKQFATKEDLGKLPTMKDLELLGKTLTIRLGGMIFLGIGALAALTQF